MWKNHSKAFPNLLKKTTSKLLYLNNHENFEEITNIAKSLHVTVNSKVCIFTSVLLRCFRDPNRVLRIENLVPRFKENYHQVPRIKENYHQVPRIKENWVPRIRQIGSLQVHIGYLTVSLKKTLIFTQHTFPNHAVAVLVNMNCLPKTSPVLIPVCISMLEKCHTFVPVCKNWSGYVGDAKSHKPVCFITIISKSFKHDLDFH